MKSRFLVVLSVFFVFSNSAVCADIFGVGEGLFEIEFVTIGDPGNEPDSDDGDVFQSGEQNLGAVPYVYRIGKYEITEDMVDKVDAVTNLTTDPFGIQHSDRGANKPVTSITWYQMARFVNWLNTSTGNKPAYKFSEFETVIELWEPGDEGYDPNNLYRNSLAKYFLPSADEWYKAAYYDPISDSYFDYATGSDIEPLPVASGTASGTAVYGQSNEAGPADVNLAGGLSPFGTVGQGGNVQELEETDYDFVNNSRVAVVGRRGGWWSVDSEFDAEFLSASVRFPFDPSRGQLRVGFRVASIAVIPEPSTLLLSLFAFLSIDCRRSRLS